MVISKRKYYCDFILAMAVVGVLIFIGAPIANHYLFHYKTIDVICRYALFGELTIITAVFFFLY